MSLGTVNTLRIEASNAVANCVDEAKQYVQQQPVVGADETSFKQGNIDRRRSVSGSAEVILNKDRLGSGLRLHHLLHFLRLV